ncbi:MAG: AraC family transcriptional regulator [Rikenellaceae bacterium]|nr:AraC family transcriptional regulator [Rikenellaceae bacterium]
MKNSPSSQIRFHYLIPNKLDEEYGCTVSTVGMQVISAGEDYPSREHPTGYMFDPSRGRILQEYQLLYIIDGRGEFFNQTGCCDVIKGSLILLRPGIWHSYKPRHNSGWTEYFIGFNGELVEGFVKRLFGDEEQVYNIGLNRELVDLYQRAIEVASESRPSSQQLLCGIVMHMLGVVNFSLRNSTHSIDRLAQVIEQAKVIMQENVSRNISLEDIASQLNVSYSWFRKIFRDYTGHAPAHYFMLMKLRRAQYLLANTQEPIKEIAFILGFKSAEHFFVTFKRVTGYTPNAYRKLSLPDKG